MTGLTQKGAPHFYLKCCAVLAVLTFGVAQVSAATNSLKVHEWGTFTSIAGSDGTASAWQPLGGPNDLPCFINHLANDASLKAGLIGKVRMETPVLYFYTPDELTITAQVRFPQGLITEWYPHADVASSSGPANVAPMELRRGAITWRDVVASPRGAPEFPLDASASHYYAARGVDAAPLRVGKEQEKFLFYRGVGNFALPLAATSEGGAVVVRNLTGDPIDAVILFVKHGDEIGYRLAGALPGHTKQMIEIPRPQGHPMELRDRFERILVDHGLYPAEAKAMLQTWQKAWFEEGARLLYLMPRSAVDDVLPLSLTPKPDELARVFVGRLEVITQDSLMAVQEAITRDDLSTLERYGRFALPMIDRVSASRGQDLDGLRFNRLRAAVYASNATEAPRCP
jgi:hypothetical protein